RVFDKPVAVGIAKLVDPAQRGANVGPDFADEGKVARALVVSACEQDEQRRAINRAVVSAERHLFQCGHLALSHFMKDLARFGVLLLVHLSGLLLREKGEDPARKVRPEPETLESRDQAVAAERSIEPRHARIRIRTGAERG